MTLRSFDHPSFDATDEALLPTPELTPPVEAHKARSCQCDSPMTYREEDYELRCLRCGRAVGP